MGFQPTIEAIVELIGSILLFSSWYVVFKTWRKFRGKAIQLIQFPWLLFSIFTFLNFIAFSFQSLIIYRYRMLLFFPLLIILEYSIELLEFGETSLWRFGVVVFLSTLLSVTVFFNDSVGIGTLPNGEPTFRIRNWLRITFLIASLWILISYNRFLYKLWKSAPEKSKKETLMHLSLFVIGGSLLIILIISGYDKLLPASDTILLSIIVITSNYIFSKNPKMYFYIRFKPMKLVVVKLDSGLTIYDHDWISGDFEITTQLLTTVLESIQLFVNEVIDRGRLQEIILDQGVILLENKQDLNLAFVLLAEESSYILRRSFDYFIELFNQVHSLDENNPVVSLDQFKKVDQLLKEAFPWI